MAEEGKTLTFTTIASRAFQILSGIVWPFRPKITLNPKKEKDYSKKIWSGMSRPDLLSKNRSAQHLSFVKIIKLVYENVFGPKKRVIFD